MDERLRPETAVGIPALGRELGAVARRRARSRLVSSLLANRLASFGVLILALVCLSAVFADALASHNPRVGDLVNSKLPPAFLPGGDPRFILGTDELGRDILSRVIHGSRISLLVGFTAVALAGLIGVVLGASSQVFTAAGLTTSSCASPTFSWPCPLSCWPSPSWPSWAPAFRTSF